MHRSFDATKHSQKVISAVSLLSKSSNINYIIDFLTGSDSEKVEVNHRQFELFGSGRGVTKQDWLNLIRDLISMGYLNRHIGRESLLTVTEKGKKVTNGEEKVLLMTSPFRKNEKAIVVSGRRKVPDFEPDLLQLLKETRIYLARLNEVDAEDIVPYLRLHQMATYLPDNQDDLMIVARFDDAQLKSYGTAFLKVINEYVEVNGLKSRMHLKRQG